MRLATVLLKEFDLNQSQEHTTQRQQTDNIYDDFRNPTFAPYYYRRVFVVHVGMSITRGHNRSRSPLR